MLTIRHEQRSVLRDAAIRLEEERMLRHMQRFFPQRCPSAVAGSPEDVMLRALVAEALVRARGWGFHTSRQQVRFLGLCGAYGWDFDGQATDQPWMRAILRDARIGSADERLRHLYATAAHRDRIEQHNRALADIASAARAGAEVLPLSEAAEEQLQRDLTALFEEFKAQESSHTENF